MYPFCWEFQFAAVDGLLLAWPCRFLRIFHAYLALSLDFWLLRLDANLPLNEFLDLILSYFLSLLRFFGTILWTG